MHTYQKSVSGPNSSLPCWIRIIFLTIVFHDSRVCHDLDWMVIQMYILGQGRSAYIPEKPFLGHNSLPSNWVLIIFHAIVVHDTRACHELDPRSYLLGQGHSTHITKFLVILIITGNLDGEDTSLICCPWHRLLLQEGGYRPYLISFVWTLTSYKGIWWLCKLPFLAETAKQNKNMLLFGLKPITFDSAVWPCITLSMEIIVKDDLKFMYL